MTVQGPRKGTATRRNVTQGGGGGTGDVGVSGKPLFTSECQTCALLGKETERVMRLMSAMERPDQQWSGRRT